VADTEFPKPAFFIEPTRHQGSIVEALMILHGHDKPPLVCDFLDFNGLRIFQH
jgi:hypothetical protein